MKKAVSIMITFALLCTCLFGCRKKIAALTEPQPLHSFIAEIITVNGNSVTVAPLDGKEECNTSDLISFSYQGLDNIAQVGNIVKIYYDGNIMESYPAQIHAIDWELISNDQSEEFIYYKPVIYLYPQAETQISVQLDMNGRLTCTYPAYNNGWNVTATPEGILIDNNGKTYNYLYWEAQVDAAWDLSEGFCIPGEDTALFLESALEQLGLTRKEANEFIVYWLPLMEFNPYNVIYFQTIAYTESVKLEISPAPDTILRVFMVWHPLDRPVEIPAQVLHAPERKGLTVVEWGGTQI